MSWCAARCLEGVHDGSCTPAMCLVRAARDGVPEAKELLFTRLLPLARQRARRLCGSEALQEDLVQTALLQALQHLSELRRPERFAAWVRRILRNAFLMEARAEGYRMPVAQVRGSSAMSPVCEASLDARLALKRVIELVPLLPPLLGETFRLRVLEGLSTRETAEQLGVSEQAVRARLSRARKKLRHAAGVQDQAVAATGCGEPLRPSRRPAAGGACVE
ncbi:MAG: RNA polymerase sigma factor [Bryobacteraceae bacterium]